MRLPVFSSTDGLKKRMNEENNEFSTTKKLDFFHIFFYFRFNFEIFRVYFLTVCPRHASLRIRARDRPDGPFRKQWTQPDHNRS